MTASIESMVTAAARALCKNASEVCNVDFEDNWKIYGDEIYKPEARLALDACGAPELLEALEALLTDVGRANSMLGAVKARAAIAKATGAAA